MNSTINKKKSFLVVLLALVLTNSITYYFSSKKNEANTDTSSINSDSSLYANGSSNCSYNVKRLTGYDYIKPLLFVDNQCESDQLSPLKQSIVSLIENYKNLGTLNSASVYVKEYSANEWIGINTEEKFLPGSLMKVPELITFLKMEEAHPGLLNKEILYNQTFIVDKNPKYLSKTIQKGQKYTVRELLTYMIAYSDNNATSLLFANMDTAMFKKVFTDIGLEAPDLTAQNYPITAKEFSYFMRSLYNASYLNIKNSEFASELLNKCNFKEGLVSGLPASVKVAHKFGEAGDPAEQQLSESAIVYLNNNPYVITIMTKGKDYKNLPEVIKQISSMVYQNMANNAKIASL